MSEDQTWIEAAERFGIRPIGEPLVVKLQATADTKGIAAVAKALRKPIWRRRGITVEWEPHDLWIGVYWRRIAWPIITTAKSDWRYDVWVCLIPCLPIRIWWVHKGARQDT